MKVDFPCLENPLLGEITDRGFLRPQLPIMSKRIKVDPDEWCEESDKSKEEYKALGVTPEQMRQRFQQDDEYFWAISALFQIPGDPDCTASTAGDRFKFESEDFDLDDMDALHIETYDMDDWRRFEDLRDAGFKNFWDALAKIWAGEVSASSVSVYFTHDEENRDGDYAGDYHRLHLCAQKFQLV